MMGWNKSQFWDDDDDDGHQERVSQPRATQTKAFCNLALTHEGSFNVNLPLRTELGAVLCFKINLKKYVGHSETFPKNV